MKKALVSLLLLASCADLPQSSAKRRDIGSQRYAPSQTAIYGTGYAAGRFCIPALRADPKFSPVLDRLAIGVNPVPAFMMELPGYPTAQEKSLAVDAVNWWFDCLNQHKSMIDMEESLSAARAQQTPVLGALTRAMVGKSSWGQINTRLALDYASATPPQATSPQQQPPQPQIVVIQQPPRRTTTDCRPSYLTGGFVCEEK